MRNTFLINLAFLIIIFHFPIPTSSMKSTTILTDRSALLALKHHVNPGPQDVLARNWSVFIPVCNWFGVSCGSKHRRVTSLDLTGLGLVGTLPTHLGNLSFLSLLDLSNNSFHGRLPVQLSNLQRLKRLSFGGNRFSGEIPPWLGSLTQLQELNLHENDFEGVLPFCLGYLSKLEILDLSGNQISGSIPSSIFNISSLQAIVLSHNRFSDNIPKDMFHRLSNLEILDLSANQLKGSLPVEIGNLTKLQEIYIYENDFEGEIPIQILNLTLLTIFDCSQNHLTGTIPHEIDKLKNLEVLNFAINNLVGSIPPQLFNISTLSKICLNSNHLSGHLPPNMGLSLPNLEKIYLGINQLVGPIPMSISNASQLVVFSITSNYFSGPIPGSFGNLRNLKRLNLEYNNLTSAGLSFLSSLTNCRGLETLNFARNPLIKGKLPPGLVGNLSTSLQNFYASSCNIGGSIPNEIGNLSGLIIIRLSENKLTGKIPATIRGLKELQELSLGGNKLVGSIPSEVCHLNNLSSLHLTRNKLSGPIPACLGDLISLKELYLGSNFFSSSIPSTLTGLNDLLILNLSANSLSGPLPNEIGNWEVLTSMDLSNNHLSSDIPNDVANLKDLTYFSLSNNEITGSIPESFGDLSSLESLDLSRNNLSGEIPKSLERIRYLKYFNVSFNRLRGEVPEVGPFEKDPVVSYEGNEALCGQARYHVPSCKARNSKRRTKLIIYLVLPIASTTLVVSLIIIILERRKKKDKFLAQEDLIQLGTWRRMSYHELYQGTDGFSDKRLLGNGSYGSVYKGILSNGIEVAVKVFKLEREAVSKSFDVECEVLRNIRHRNLIKIISSCSNDLDFKALVLEFMPNRSLDKWLHSGNLFLDILQRLDIMIDVASALEYLHHGNETSVVHCDLKPSNVLLDEDMVAHLCDFSIAKLLCKVDSLIQTMTIATIGYMAPEYGSEGIVSTKGDVYSFGILIMEVITKKKPTDEMFGEERSLKSWVKDSVSSSLNHVVDTNLLRTTGRQQLAANNCALSILHVGLECSVEMPDERPDMREIVIKLMNIKGKMLEDIEKVR